MSSVGAVTDAEAGRGEVGASAAGYHRRDAGAGLGRGPQRGGGAGAGAEVSDGQAGGAGLGGQPSGDVGEAPGEQADVEHVGPVEFLRRGEQVEQECAQARLG